MQELFYLLFNLYRRSVEAHIRSKTECYPFHKFSEQAYLTLFEVAHKIGERSEDICEPINGMDDDAYKMDLYNAIEEAKNKLELYASMNNSVGTDNLLRGLIDDLEDLCGSARAFIKEEEEETEEEEMEEPFIPLPNGQTTTPRIYPIKPY